MIGSDFTSFLIPYPRSIVHSSLRFSQSGPSLQAPREGPLHVP